MRLVTRLKGIQTIKKRKADGTIRLLHYHRASGTRLPDDAGSEAFLAAYRAAEKELKAKPLNTIEALVDAFRDSADWQKMRESKREIMALNLKAGCKKFGDMPVEALKDRRVRAVFLGWHDHVAQTHPRAADAKLSALQRVLGWAHDRALAPANPIEKFRRAYTSNRVDKIWLPHHVSAFEGVAKPEIALALHLALHTGQRQGDLIRLTWKAFDGAGLALIQSKTRTRIYIPCTAALLAALQEEKVKARGAYILTAPHGRPWTSDAIKSAWTSTFKQAGIEEDLHFNDLRGTAVTMLAEAGCTVPEIAAITGHSLRSATRILEVYLARTKVLANAAILKLNEHARNKTVNASVNGTQK